MNRQKGFSLIELLIVVVIIGLATEGVMNTRASGLHLDTAEGFCNSSDGFGPSGN